MDINLCDNTHHDVTTVGADEIIRKFKKLNISGAKHEFHMK